MTKDRNHLRKEEEEENVSDKLMVVTLYIYIFLRQHACMCNYAFARQRRTGPFIPLTHCVNLRSTWDVDRCKHVTVLRIINHEVDAPIGAVMFQSAVMEIQYIQEQYTG